MNAISTSIENLCTDIRAANSACLSSIDDALQHARRAGESLTRLKAAAEHGSFESIVKDRCGIQPRTARTYMRISSGWGTIEEAKRSGRAVLTIDAAKRLLSRPRTEKSDAKYEIFVGGEGNVVFELWPANEAAVERDRRYWFGLMATGRDGEPVLLLGAEPVCLASALATVVEKTPFSFADGAITAQPRTPPGADNPPDYFHMLESAGSYERFGFGRWSAAAKAFAEERAAA